MVACLLTMACMDVLSRIIGLRRTCGLIRRMMPSQPEPRAAAEIVNQTMHNVAVAGAFYPRRALCLEQSLTLFLLLRRRGVPAELRLGVQPRPFHAHAWVEAGGRPIGESANLPLTLVAFPGLGV